MTYRNQRASVPARHRVAIAGREWSRGRAYENSIPANDRYLEPVADYRGRANGVRAGAGHGTDPPPLISLPEARAIIEGAIAYAREANLRMAVVVVDHAGNVVSADRMDGAALQNIRFAESKVAGLPEGVDEKSARAGIAAWMKLRGTMKK